MINPMENVLNGNNEGNNVEQLRQQLSQEVRQGLEKYKDKITQFNLLTISTKARGSWETNEGIKPVQYDSRYDTFFEFHNYNKTNGNDTSTGYIYDIEVNKATFSAYLGKCLPPEKRQGNLLKITLKFEKGFNPRELLHKIGQLMDTVIPYTDLNNNEDIVNICKESITVLEAFEDISEKFPSNGHISVQSMIEEYREIIAKLA